MDGALPSAPFPSTPSPPGPAQAHTLWLHVTQSLHGPGDTAQGMSSRCRRAPCPCAASTPSRAHGQGHTGRAGRWGEQHRTHETWSPRQRSTRLRSGHRGEAASQGAKPEQAVGRRRGAGAARCGHGAVPLPRSRPRSSGAGHEGCDATPQAPSCPSQTNPRSRSPPR